MQTIMLYFCSKIHKTCFLGKSRTTANKIHLFYLYIPRMSPIITPRTIIVPVKTIAYSLSMPSTFFYGSKNHKKSKAWVRWLIFLNRCCQAFSTKVSNVPKIALSICTNHIHKYCSLYKSYI